MVKFKKIKKRKLILFVFILIVLFYGIFRSKSYEIEYSLGEVTVLEKFQKEKKSYDFIFKVKEKEFFVSLEQSYIHSKKLIQNVDVKEKGDTLCIVPKGKKLDLYPLCIQNNEYVSFHLIEDDEIIDSSLRKEITYEQKNFKNMSIYSLNNKKYFIWNYEGFTVLSGDSQKEIKLFNEDIYNIPLAIKTGNYLIIADYNAKYVFSKFYVINTKNNKVRELDVDKEISFDSYFLGTTDKKVYLVDKKNKKEYEIDPKRLKFHDITKKNQGRILNNGEWEVIGMNALVNNDVHFQYKFNTTYELLDGILFKVQGDYKTKLSNQSVKEIIYVDESIVYYLIEDKLYYYTDSDGEVLVMRNFEWNFNYKNMIYVF